MTVEKITQMKCHNDNNGSSYNNFVASPFEEMAGGTLIRIIIKMNTYLPYY